LKLSILKEKLKENEKQFLGIKLLKPWARITLTLSPINKLLKLKRQKGIPREL